jgi:hypothetical protein
MNKYLKKFHLANIAAASDHHLCIAVALLFGAAPKEGAIDEARKMLSENNEDIWIFPALQNCKLIEKVLASPVFAATFKKDRAAAYSTLASTFLHVCGGLIGLDRMIKDANESFAESLVKYGSILEVIDGLEAAVETGAAKGKPEVAPDAKGDVGQPAKEADDTHDAHVEVRVIRVSADGTVTGDIDDAPEELKAFLRDVAKSRTGKSGSNTIN